MHKVQRPFLVGRRALPQWCTHSHAVFALLSPQAQPRFPIHKLVVHGLTTSLQQHMQTPIAEPRLLAGDLDQLRAQRIIRSSCFIAITADCHRQQPADPALAGRVLFAQPARIRPLVYELQPFFAITAFSISRSWLRSATIFFSRWFSSSSSRNRRASFTSSPPYFAFQAYQA